MIPVSGYGLAWEQSADAAYLSSGNLKAFKQVIQNDKEDKYKNPDLILEALPTAISSGNVELVKYLASLGWLEVCSKDEFCKPIHVAALYGRVGVIKFLVSRGFDVKAIDVRGSTPLHHAAEMGHIAVTMYLCEQGVDYKAVDRRGATALDEAKVAAQGRVLDPKENARRSANLARVIEYLESGQCKKK